MNNIAVTADLDDEGLHSFIHVEGIGLLTLTEARQLMADLDEEIARAEVHDEAQSSSGDWYDYHRAVA